MTLKFDKLTVAWLRSGYVTIEDLKRGTVDYDARQRSS